MGGIKPTNAPKRIVSANQFFQFAEIPLMFAVVWCGLNFIPEWVALPYEKLLLWSTPFFVLLEGLSAIVIILECGERCSQALVSGISFEILIFRKRPECF